MVGPGQEGRKQVLLVSWRKRFAENEDKFGPQALIPLRDFYCKK